MLGLIKSDIKKQKGIMSIFSCELILNINNAKYMLIFLVNSVRNTITKENMRHSLGLSEVIG